MNTKYYFDYNATTPLHPEAMWAMHAFSEGNFGNPSSVHSFGRAARAALDNARNQLAQLLDAQSKEIIFTSGGTESNNLAVFGVSRAMRSKGRHIITCTTEHHSVLNPCQYLAAHEGFEVTFLPVDSYGKTDLELLSRSFRNDTILVSIMSANNETGTRHSTDRIGAMCRERSILFHCDAIQSFGKEPVDVNQWNVDLLSIAAHKFYGPKGVALLYVRSGTPIQSTLLGGSQENNRRAGTENGAGIVGMAAAARLAVQHAENEHPRLFALTENLWTLLSEALPDIYRNGHPIDRLGNTLNVSFDRCDGESLIMGLDLENIAVSSGSACMVGSIQPSHVLKAMGVDARLIPSTVRFSLGTDSKEETVSHMADRVIHVVNSLRRHS